MKKLFSSFMICTLTYSISYGLELKSEKIAELNIIIDTPTFSGTKITYPIKAGNVSRKITGTVLPIGADFGPLISPITFKPAVREVMRTTEHATIYATYTGYIYADAETFKLLVSGNAKVVNPYKYYSRTNPIFKTTSAKYDRLTHTAVIGIGPMTDTGVNFKGCAINLK